MVRSRVIYKLLLVHCKIVKNDYQHDSRALRAFVPKKSLCQLDWKKLCQSDISPDNFTIPKNLSVRIYIYVSMVC